MIMLSPQKFVACGGVSFLLVGRGQILLVMIVYGSFAVLSDTAKRLDYDLTGNYEIDKYTLPV